MSVLNKHYDTILAPVITEKSTGQSEQNKVVIRVPLGGLLGRGRRGRRSQ